MRSDILLLKFGLFQRPHFETWVSFLHHNALVSGKTGGLPLFFQAIQVDRHLLHVLHGCRHKGLFPDVWKTAQTAIAKPMELFGIREASLNRLFSFAVQLFTG
jgi:hypothetical protein